MVRRLVVFTIVAAVAVFCVVQDRVTAAGARRYAALARTAAARHERVNVDEVMQPAIRSSVRQGLSWAGAVMIAGFGAAAVIGRSARG